MVARWLAFLVWAAAAAGAVAWGLKLFVRAPTTPAHASLAVPSAASGDLSRLFGEAAPAPADEEEPAPAADARFQLIGVVAPRPAGAAAEGLALISVDGKPPRAYRVGAAVDGEQVLQAVQPRGATLGPRGGAALVALTIPPPAAANTGTLPMAGAAGGSGTPGMSGLAGLAGRGPSGLPTARYLPPGARMGRPQPAPPAEAAETVDAAEALAPDAVPDGAGSDLPTR